MSYRSMLFILTLMLSAFILVLPSVAQWEELPEKGTQLDFGGSRNEMASAFTGQAVHAGEAYWVGVQGTEIRANEEIASQDLAARAQGGISKWGGSLQGFVEFEKEKDEELTSGIGFYLRKVFTKERLKVVLGGGSMVENQKKELGLDEETTPDTLPYYLVIFGSEYNVSPAIDIYGKVVGKPEVDLSTVEGILTLGLDIALAENLSLKLQSVSDFVYDGDDGVEEFTEISGIVSVNF